MAKSGSFDAGIVTSSPVLRDYLYSRMRSGAKLTLSDKLLGLALLGHESARNYGSEKLRPGEVFLSPQVVGQLKGYLLNSRSDVDDILPVPDILSDYFNVSCGRITKVRT